jgi:flagellar hook-basal body complex protein FliE
MWIRSRVAVVAVLCGFSCTSTVGTAEESPQAKRFKELSAQRAVAVLDRAASARQAFEAMSETFLAGGNVSLGDVLMAMDIRLGAERSLIKHAHEMAAVYEKHRLTAKRLGSKIRALCQAGEKGDEIAQSMETYRILAEIQSLQILAHPPSPDGPDERDNELAVQLKQIRIERLTIATQAATTMSHAYVAGHRVALSDVLMAMDARVKAELALSGGPQGMRGVYEHHRELTNHLGESIAGLVAAGKKGTEAARLIEPFQQAAEFKVMNPNGEKNAQADFLVDRATSAQQAIDAISEAFARNKDVPLADVLMALDAQLEVGSAAVGDYPNMIAAREKQIAAASRLEEVVTTLCKEGKRGEETAKLMKAYRQNAEIKLIEMELSKTW